VQIRYYSIIYEVIDDVKAAMEGLLDPDIREDILGYVEVREVFKAPKIGTIAGCIVTEGIVRRNANVRVLRDSVVIFEGNIDSLRRFKDDVSEVKNGTECGIGVTNYNDIKEGDQLEIFEKVEVKVVL
jgi:translation initiation factor IF-2